MAHQRGGIGRESQNDGKLNNRSQKVHVYCGERLREAEVEVNKVARWRLLGVSEDNDFTLAEGGFIYALRAEGTGFRQYIGMIHRARNSGWSAKFKQFVWRKTAFTVWRRRAWVYWSILFGLGKKMGAFLGILHAFYASKWRVASKLSTSSARQGLTFCQALSMTAFRPSV